MIKNMNLKKWLVFISLIMLIFAVNGCKQKSVDRLLEEGKYGAAEKRCERAKVEEKSECFKKIAAFYLQKEQYRKAALFYARAGEHLSVINCYFQGDLIQEAEAYCAGQTGAAKKQCMLRLAKKFFIDGNAEKAVHYYQAAGEIKMALFIESRMPIFQLVEVLGRKAKEVKNPGVRETMTGIKPN